MMYCVLGLWKVNLILVGQHQNGPESINSRVDGQRKNIEVMCDVVAVHASSGTPPNTKAGLLLGSP